jgi:glyoxylase-like metal-dependent hydrolase (beta-lactamase superfamily II)
MFIRTLAILAVMCLPATADENIADQYPGSLLYSKPVEVIPHVWSAIGATAPPNYENSGHNNNLSFIVTGDGVVVINGGAAHSLAKALHDEIKKITDQSVKYVINENGQGHAALGNSYWAELGVPIIAHVDAAHELKERGHQILENMKRYNRDKSDGTTIALPIEILHLGPAHSPGDTQVWLPKQNLVIAGDMAFHERLLPIFDDTMTADWVQTWETEFEALNATYVIPGHGHPTNMDQVRRYTHDYLVYLRGKIGEHLEEDGDLAEAYYVDQSPYAHLHTFNELATRNAGRVYEQMEFE